MSSRSEYSRIVEKARKEAFNVVEKAVRISLPSGWCLHLAVGWGLVLTNHNKDVVVGGWERAARLPKGLRKACLLAADYVDTFGYGNEIIKAS